MPKLLYSLICSDIIVDGDSGSASYIRVFEHGSVPKLPAQVPPFFVASLWELDPKDQTPFTVHLALVLPNGKKQELGKNTVQPKGTLMHKLNFRLPGLKIENEGRHDIAIAVEQDGKTKVATKLPLHIFLKPPADKAN